MIGCGCGQKVWALGLRLWFRLGVGCMTITVWASGVRATKAARLCRRPRHGRSRHGRPLQGRSCLQGRRAAATERGPRGIAPLGHAQRQRRASATGLAAARVCSNKLWQRRVRWRWRWLLLLPRAAPLALCACAPVHFLLRRHQGVGGEG